jgi:RimJ/RimL family protein N-acetyltransferase
MSQNGREKPVVFLQGNLVSLRAPELADVPDIIRWTNNPEVRQFMTMTEALACDDEMEWLKKFRDNPNNIVLSIVFEQTGQMIGGINLSRISWVNRYATFGIMIGQHDLHKLGLGTEATRLMIRYAFHTLGLRMLKSSVLAPNIASVALHRKVGFQENFRRPGQYLREGRWVDEIIYGLLRSEWEDRE